MLFESLPGELQDLAALARKITEQRIAPLVPELERSRAFAAPVRDILAEAGFLGIVVPEEFGGVTTDLRHEVIIMEEVSRVYPSGSTILTANWVPTKLIARAAGDGYDQPWMAPMLQRAAAGEVLGAIAATEPEAGSDLAALRTRAVRDGDRWVISGNKRFITNGGQADYYVVLARTGDAGPGGISLLYVEADRPGVTVARLEDKMGLHGSATAELVFDDVEVPLDHLIGAEGSGFKATMHGFDHGRVVVAALALGIAAGALDASVRYASERSQFGRTIASFQGLQFLIADMAIGVDTARAIVYDAADACVQGLASATRLAAVAKTYASDMAMQVTTDAVQVHGGYGYVTDFPVEMLMRDAKINQIYEGTNQIQRMLIARALFGEAAR